MASFIEALNVTDKRPQVINLFIETLWIQIISLTGKKIDGTIALIETHPRGN